MINDFISGIIAGFILTTFISGLPFSDSYKYRKAIAECEASLTRNQHCKVIGIKDDSK